MTAEEQEEVRAEVHKNLMRGLGDRVRQCEKDVATLSLEVSKQRARADGAVSQVRSMIAAHERSLQAERDGRIGARLRRLWNRFWKGTSL